MLRYGKSTLGAIARPRTAIAVMTAALVFGGTVSEASAKSRQGARGVCALRHRFGLLNIYLPNAIHAR